MVKENYAHHFIFLWPASAYSFSSLAKLYQWTDTNGVIHVVDEAGEIPAAYRGQVKVYQSAKAHSLTYVSPVVAESYIS